jgi:hypothetical protein
MPLLRSVLNLQLRPEFIESTYFLYRTTKDPFYLFVGEQILTDLLNYTKVEVLSHLMFLTFSVGSPPSMMCCPNDMKIGWRASY